MAEGDRDDWNRADEILGADWMDPGRRLLEEAFNDHPERERLVELQQERGPDGLKTWQLVQEDDPDDPDEWYQVVLRPLDARDTRASIRIGRWPVKYVERLRREAEAIVDEHDDSP